MAAETLEGRVTAIESDLTRIKQQLAGSAESVAVPSWERIYGSFADSEGFEEAVRLGREYREALRPRDDESSS